jgi:hypothetical protein
MDPDITHRHGVRAGRLQELTINLTEVRSADWHSALLVPLANRRVGRANGSPAGDAARAEEMFYAPEVPDYLQPLVAVVPL